MGPLKSKVALVTGSSKGIGKAIALELLKAGAKVVINGRDAAAVNATTEEFLQIGYPVLAIPADVSSIAGCRELVRKTVEGFGRIDLLINNAGGGFRGAFEDTSSDVFRQVVDSNLMSAAYLTRAAIGEIKKNKGSIVFISSLSGLRGMPINAPYSVAKMGLTALAQALKLELAGTGVHIGIVMVGFTDFDENKRVVTADGSLIPIRRKSHHTREQVAKIVLKVIRKRRFMVILTPLGKAMAILQRICPALVEWIIRKSSQSQDYNK